MKINIENLAIENSLGLKSHFFYLLLLSRKRPFIKKNIIKKKLWNNSNKKVIKMITFPHKTSISTISNIFLNQLIPLQITAENPVIYITRKNIKIVAWNAPVFKETFCVQLNENSFIRDIPISITFNFNQGTLSQKVFFSTFFGFVKFSEEIEEIS